MSNAIILDVESTGFAEPVEPVEVAWVRLDAPNSMTVLETFQQRYQPSKPIECGALATHRIMDEALVNMPPSNEARLPADVGFIIGHAIDYDWSVMGKPDVRRIDTCALARRCWPECDSFSLGALLFYLDRDRALEFVRNAHAALADCEATLVLMAFIVERFKDPKALTWEKLWKASEKARIPTHMPFGKHKGMLITELPWDYREWMLRQTDMDEYVLIAVRRSMRAAAVEPLVEDEEPVAVR